MTTRISPKNDKAVLTALRGTISRTEAQKIVKTVAGRNGSVNTPTELKQLKAIRTRYADAFTADAKKLLDKEIAAASKSVVKEVRAPQRHVWGGGGSIGS